MSRTSTELHTKLKNSGEIHIADIIQIKNKPHRFHNYEVRAIADSHSNPRIETKKSITPSDIELYQSAIELVSEWHENGYADSNGWQYTKKKGHDDWRTPEGRYVRLTDRTNVSFTSTKIGDVILEDLAGASYVRETVELKLARFVLSMTPREFDYKYTKYKSMRENLKQIRGIGENVAMEILEKSNCETYEDVGSILTQTDIPQQYYHDARDALKKRAKSSEHSLIDSEVQHEYSEIIIANNI